MSSTKINNIKKILGIGVVVSLGATVLPATVNAVPEGASLDLAPAQTAQAQACRAVDADPGLNIRAQPGGEIIGSVENNNVVSLQNPNPQGQDWVEIQAPMNGYVAAAYLNYCSDAAAQQQPIARVDQEGVMSQQPGQTPPAQMEQPAQIGQPMEQPMNQPAQMEQPMTQMEGESCRAISSDGGLNVRSQPEVGSEIISTLPDATEVQIQNRGEDGWVPISEPIPGYVAAENLMMCGQ